MGYFDKLEDDSLAQRNTAFTIARGNGYKGSMNSFWPLRSSVAKTERMSITKEMYNTIKNIHNIK